MSKTGEYLVGLQGSEDYQFGWECAERGQPEPEWEDPKPSLDSQVATKLGWHSYHKYVDLGGRLP
jgi:hypothetical protein